MLMFIAQTPFHFPNLWESKRMDNILPKESNIFYAFFLLVCCCGWFFETSKKDRPNWSYYLVMIYRYITSLIWSIMIVVFYFKDKNDTNIDNRENYHPLFGILVITLLILVPMIPFIVMIFYVINIFKENDNLTFDRNYGQLVQHGSKEDVEDLETFGLKMFMRKNDKNNR